MSVDSGAVNFKENLMNSAVLPPARYVDTDVAADVLDLAPRTMRQMRWRGGGPRFYKFGNRVKYLVADLHAWAASRGCENTAQAAALSRGAETSTIAN